MSYSITVKIANSGTPLSDGEKSKVGHMWYEITDYSGEPKSYGFTPSKEGSPIGSGKVFDDDRTHYLNFHYSRTFEITKEQYEILKGYGSHPDTYGFNSTIGSGCLKGWVEPVI